jgi:hypothetical protein
VAETLARYCSNCGHELSPEDQFCQNCGHPVHQTARVPTPEADVPVPPPQQRDAGGSVPPPLQQPLTKNAGNKESPKTTIRSTISSWYNGLSKSTKIILKVAGGIVTVWSVIGIIFPSLLPLPRSMEGEGTLSNLKVVRSNETLGEYFQWPSMQGGQAEDEESRVSDDQLQRLGSIISFDITLKGFAGKTVAIRWSVFDADTGKPVSGLTEQPAWPSKYIEPQHDVSKTQRETWVPFPPNDKGTFSVQLEVWAWIKGNEVLLDYKRVKVSTPDAKAAP